MSKKPLAHPPALAAVLGLLLGPAVVVRASGPIPVTCAVPAAGALPSRSVAPPPVQPATVVDAFGGDEIGSEPELDAPHDEAAPGDGLRPAPEQDDEFAAAEDADPDAARAPRPVSLSIGTPDAGLLLNPVAMPEHAFWTIRNPVETYGTTETIQYLRRAIESVQRRFPDSPRLVVGDISRQDGGRLNRHKSHQSGRDVDLGLYYATGEAADFRDATARTLDVPRTWALVRALVTETDVERIFLDRSLTRLLLSYARDIGEDGAWLDELVGRARNGKDSILQHERRHKNHMHVRFFNPVAQDCARANYSRLIAQGLLPPPTVRHRIRSGETLSTVARRYGVATVAIKKANGMRGSFLRAGRSLVIPMRRVAVVPAAVVIPPRLLPRTSTIEESVPTADAAGPTGGR